jgi:hypothetical protein
MLQNKLIIGKLDEKTKNDLKLKSFVDKLIRIEFSGGQYYKSYEKLIKKHTKEEI